MHCRSYNVLIWQVRKDHHMKTPLFETATETSGNQLFVEPGAQSSVARLVTQPAGVCMYQHRFTGIHIKAGSDV